MRIGIVGLGRAGNVHLEAWQLVPGVEVVAACDPSSAACDRATANGLHGYADLAAMLRGEQLDAVAICTPPANHAEVATACFEHGLHVLCEKPLALNTREALRMLQTAARKQRHLILATKFRHVPEVILARDMIRAGEIGEPLAFEVSFCAPVDMSQRWNSQRHHSGGGVLIDNGCHAIDLVAFLFGPVSRVQATLLKPLQRLEVEDSVTIQMEAGDGVIGRADVSWSLSIGRESYLVVHGSRGTIEVGWSASRIKPPGQDWRAIGGGYDKIAAHRRMATCFADVVVNGGERWISALECLQNVAVVDAAYRSMQSGGWEWVAVERKGRRLAGAQ
jgi:predicted dehydrogenase